MNAIFFVVITYCSFGCQMEVKGMSYASQERCAEQVVALRKEFRRAGKDYTAKCRKSLGA